MIAATMSCQDIQWGAGSVPSPQHRPVMVSEVLRSFSSVTSGIIVDATVGSGGHAEAILKSCGEVSIIGFDRDPTAVAEAGRRLAGFGPRARVRMANFSNLSESLREELAGERSIAPGVCAILFDLGTSAMQLKTPERGFSFMSEGPLDMRMGPDASAMAGEFLRRIDERDLADIIWKYGEEPRSRRIARRIISERDSGRMRTTIDLAKTVASCVPAHPKKRIHPATKTFQAIRIAVNGEIDALASALPQALEALRPGGRLAVISFHSLEDRVVKQFIAREASDCVCPSGMPICRCGHVKRLIKIERKPVTPSAAEIESNPESRSAKLRVAEKI